MAFIAKKIHDGGTLAEDLRELRESARMSIQEASHFTKVTPGTIQAWEAGDWKRFGGELAYMERMLLAYVALFHGRVPFFQKKFQEERAKILDQPTPTAHIQALRPFSWKDALLGWRVRVALGVMALSLSLGGYFVAQARGLSEAPILVITAPHEGARMDVPTVRVEGKTSPEAQVYVNERLATMQEDGSFFTELDIPRGPTELVIRAKKRHSRESIERVRIVFDRLIEVPSEF